MWNKPVVDIRVDEFTRGTLPAYLDLQKKLALPVLEQHIGRPMAFYVSVVGTINRVTQLWGFDSYAAFEAGRLAAEKEPRWAEYMVASEGIIRTQVSRLTRRISFPGIDEIAGRVHEKPYVDFRTYLIHFNQMKVFLSTTEAHAMKVQLRHIGPPIGYYLTQVGKLNQITHIWGYDSMADMEARREARNADPEWRNYLDASDGIYERQDSHILRRLKLFAD